MIVFVLVVMIGSVMVGVVVLSRRFSINPDNVATPIAASLGDLTTISLLAALARGFYSLVDMTACVDNSCSEFNISRLLLSCVSCMFLTSCLFLLRDAMPSRNVCPSIRLSVCLSRFCILSKRMNVCSKIFTVR